MSANRLKTVLILANLPFLLVKIHLLFLQKAFVVLQSFFLAMVSDAQPTIARNEFKIDMLQKYKTKVLTGCLEKYALDYDISSTLTLSAPSREQSVYHHSSGLVPIYWHHLDYGLRLLLHPFLQQVLRALRVSPVQLKPIFIALMVAFLIICHRVNIEPTLGILCHFVCVKTGKKEGHFYLQIVSAYWLVTNILETNKEWREKLFFVLGTDLILACPTWPEIKKEGVRSKSSYVVPSARQ